MAFVSNFARGLVSSWTWDVFVLWRMFFEIDLFHVKVKKDELTF